ncbi:unnamed protein product [Albugo candida]|uniref:Uncharacterized protein n=1 Tax=Albugo candida TaxID=65357 RepID=A0A024GPH8_9STRA|nr:unnamed protein product [Albugo candida]|eukprot:CCI48262.1 unnamed protein product [Albugo candida]
MSSTEIALPPPSGLLSFLTGGIGGMCLVATGHPMDLIKVNMQTMEKPKAGEAPMYSSALDCARKIVAKDGRAICNTPSDKSLSMGQIMFAGGFSAIPTTVVMAPGERLKCLLQIQAQAVAKGEPKLYDGMLHCAKQLYRTGGISSIFRGWEATLLRDVPGSVGYFGGFEGIKRLMTPANQDAAQLNAFRTFVAGGFAGTL